MERKDFELIREIYPHAKGIFSIQTPALAVLKDSAIFVIDTNALLLPYQTSSKGIDEIKNVYRKLISNKQLIIPGQVAREFANNRPEKIKELFQIFNRQKQTATKFLLGKYPILESFADYIKLKDSEKELAQKLTEYTDYINNLLSLIKGWQWNDPVSSIYSELFTPESVHDYEIDWDNFIADTNRRYELKIPPGFKDGGKDDGGYGDLLIWMEIIEIARKFQKSIIFVSGEEKTDWYYRSEGQILYPRFELLSEFHSKTNCFFTIIKFSDFLEISGANEEVISEIKSEEIKTTDRNYKRTINILIEKEILKEGDIILLNKNLPEGIAFETNNSFFQAEVTGKLGKSDTIKWLYDGGEYSISALTTKIFSKMLDRDFGPTNGNWFWSKNDQTLWDLSVGAL